MAISNSQVRALNNASPAALNAGAGIGNLFAAVFQAIDGSNLGIKSDSIDVDSLTKGGGFFSHDYDADEAAGLSFDYEAGRIWIEGSGYLNVAAGSVGLSASLTNYIEVRPDGVVQKKTTGFTVGNLPLYIVVAGSANITSVTPAKPLLSLPPVGGYPGALLSTAAKTIRLPLQGGVVSATTSWLIHCPSHAAKLIKSAVLVDTAVATDAVNYWTFSLTNKGVGVGNTAMLAATNANTTNTGGSGLSAYVQRSLTLHGTAANLDTAANDTLVFTATKAGAAPNLSSLSIDNEFTFDV